MTRQMISSLVAMVALQMSVQAQADHHKGGEKKDAPAAATGAYCFGVVAAGEGQCGGEGHGCAGQNKTADSGWVKATLDECKAKAKHKTATAKKFCKDAAGKECQTL